MQIPQQLAGWINQRSEELFDGVEVQENIKGFDVHYNIAWQEGNDATVVYLTIKHDFVGKPYLFSGEVIDEIVKSPLFRHVDKQIKDLCALIDFAEAAYGWKFER
jgi:hypothetical protein